MRQAGLILLALLLAFAAFWAGCGVVANMEGSNIGNGLVAGLICAILVAVVFVVVGTLRNEGDGGGEA